MRYPLPDALLLVDGPMALLGMRPGATSVALVITYYTLLDKLDFFFRIGAFFCITYLEKNLNNNEDYNG